MNRKLIVGTRGSDLALWQASFVKDKLAGIGIEAELKIIKTQGDSILNLRLDKLEGKGFFTKELEEELLASTIDLAVHSHKDLPTVHPAGLTVAAVSDREDPSDVLLILKDWGTHDTVADFFVGNGVNFLKFNFSHNGTTPQSPSDFTDLEAFGNNTFSKELFDLDQVITFAEKRKEFSGSTGNIYLIGHSLGGGISIIQSAEDKRVKKLVTWASVGKFRNLWMTEAEPVWRSEGVIYVDNARTGQKMPLRIELLKDLEQNSEKFDILSAAQKIDRPWLIVHGDKDPTVPVEQAFELNRQQSQSRLLIIENGDHVFGAKHPWLENALPADLNQVAKATLSFLKS